ncbi:Squalene epoxidase [Clydaea vesicula]|uniref:Squalene monooxygenase n=1 Tax=Clydaea vesicula TaxID=447962 RepID=A0AAD5XYF0_9FUNG|nr:Squalene epoxidase [Clydaea vesicula]KAJ3395365.1 Squalene epoxidase [Lobulomyces angularis]
MGSYDVIIVGSGVIGSALAIAFANQGRKVLLIERDWSEPDRIVGELMQPGGVKALQKIGIEHCLEGIHAVDCNGYAIFKENEKIILNYPVNKSPNQGKSFHHGRFIMNLRNEANSKSNVTVLEATVTQLIEDTKFVNRVIGVKYKKKKLTSFKTDSKLDLSNFDNETIEEESIIAPFVVIADGCFSKFRKQLINKSVEIKSHFVGFILKKCDLPNKNYGHVILAKPSPILLYQISGDDTRILIDIPGKLPNVSNGEMNKYLLDYILPQLPKSIQVSFSAAVEISKARIMPNSFLPPSKNLKEGLLILGDAMNMRHPLTGGGMTVALWDVVHVSDLLHPLKFKNFNKVKKVSEELKKLHWKRKPLSSVINILAQALYSLFSAGDNINLIYLQEACFGYFKLGGRCVSTPVGLLAGLIPSPLTLLGHFFAVAFYGTFLIIRKNWIYLPFALIRSFLVIFTAAMVIGPVIISELKN